MSTNELVMRRLAPGEDIPEPGRGTRVASWLVWHALELGSVAAPALVAVAVTPWAWPVAVAAWSLSAVAGAWWAVRAIRRAREQAAIKAGRDLPPPSDTDADHTDADTDAGNSEVDTEVGAGTELADVANRLERRAEEVWL